MMKYLNQLEEYKKMMKVAIWALQKFPAENLPIDYYLSFIERYKSDLQERSNILTGKFAVVASLKYDISNALIYFNEGSGQAIEEFWKKIKEENLPFKRENKLKKILKRKKIANDIEFDFVTDVLVPYIQEGLITQEEEMLLKQYIGDYEGKKR
jgi:hypothetical protein